MDDRQDRPGSAVVTRVEAAGLPDAAVLRVEQLWLGGLSLDAAIARYIIERELGDLERELRRRQPVAV